MLLSLPHIVFFKTWIWKDHWLRPWRSGLVSYGWLFTCCLYCSTDTITYSSFSQLELLVRWHSCLGHISFPMLRKLFLGLCSSISNFHYETCELAKYCPPFYSPCTSRNTTPFSLVHFDVWGLTRITSLFGFHYFVTFFDDYFKATWIYLLYSEHEVFLTFQLFHKLAETQFDTKLKVLRSNNRGCLMPFRLISLSVASFIRLSLKERIGIFLRLLMPYSFICMSPKFYTLQTIAYLMNNIPSRILGFKCPIELLSCSFLSSSLP